MEVPSTVRLAGSHWKDPTRNVYFAISCIAIIIVIGCITFARSFKSTVSGGKDKLRNIGYVISGSFTLLNLILSITQLAAHESRAIVTRFWFIISIFSFMAWKIADVLVLAITLRTLQQALFGSQRPRSGFGHAFPNLSRAFIIILTLISMADFGLYTCQTAVNIRGFYTDIHTLIAISRAMIGTTITYCSLYIIASIFILVTAGRSLLRQKSRASLIVTIVIGPWLFLSPLFGLVIILLSYYAASSGSDAISWAATYIQLFATIFVYIGLALITRSENQTFGGLEPEVEDNASDSLGTFISHPSKET